MGEKSFDRPWRIFVSDKFDYEHKLLSPVPDPVVLTRWYVSFILSHSVK